MNLLSIGISHTTASVEIREKMWMSPDEIRAALTGLRERFFRECMIVSTCNRTEVYGITPELTVDDADLRRFLIEFKGAGEAVTPDHFFGTYAGGAVNHLFKVAAGIDSMVIGDIQILNQVKEAFQTAQDMELLGPVMNRLMQATLHVGKRVRAETAIGEGAVSVSYAAVELASKIFEDLSRKSALMIGAGETGELTVRHLVGRGIGDLQIANRTRARAEALVAQLGGRVVDYEQLADALRSADIVITSVSSPSYIVSPPDVQKVMKQRSHNPLFIIDIGVPRNVDPASRKIDNVFLYDIDSLSAIVDRNVERRAAEIPKVTAIIREEMVEFFRWHNSLQVGPTIHDLREALEGIRREEVEKNINRFAAQDRELVELLTKRIVNKILHQPMTALKEGAGNGAGGETMLRIKALRELFGMTSRKDSSHGD
jgi:glutamyl-tRNA reductase